MYRLFTTLATLRYLYYRLFTAHVVWPRSPYNNFLNCNSLALEISLLLEHGVERGLLVESIGWIPRIIAQRVGL